MTPPLFLQNVIAVVWDFDKTLIPGHMQDPLFDRYDVEARRFWAEVNALPGAYRELGLDLVSSGSLYLNHILTYVRAGRFAGLNNRVLRDLGARLEFHPGVPEIFEALTDRLAGHDGARRHDIRLEHYVVSTGLRQTILGSQVAPYVKSVWGCEFIEAVPPPGFVESGEALESTGEICQVGYVLDDTTKTRAIFEINKGSNAHPEIDVNSSIALEHRRVPFQNMIYVADGPSDVPVFSVVKGQGGRTYAVYRHGAEEELAQVSRLLDEGRLHAFGEANYEPGSQSAM
jgi:hypothetical protein